VSLSADNARTRLGRALGPWIIWLAFVTIGPFVGTAALVTGGGIVAVYQQAMERQLFLHEPVMWIVRLGQLSTFAYPLAMLFGGVQAGLVGLVAARSYVMVGRVSFAAVAIASLLTAAGFLIIIGLGARSGSEPLTFVAALGWMAIHLTAGIVCWLIVARLRGGTLSTARKDD
jgi:energy-converting hydrogenase Eha subunit C